MVDDNRIEGAARNLGGMMQEAAGRLSGDAGMQAQGRGNQLVGSAENSLGAALDEAEEWAAQLAARAKDQPLTALLMAFSAGYVLRMLTHSRA